MATKYNKVMNIKCFLNDNSAAKWGNSKFTPYKDGSPSDITLRADIQYRVSVFEDQDGSIGISITYPEKVHGADNLSDDLKQGGMKKLADTAAVQRGISLDDDDDIPF